MTFANPAAAQSYLPDLENLTRAIGEIKDSLSLVVATIALLAFTGLAFAAWLGKYNFNWFFSIILALIILTMVDSIIEFVSGVNVGNPTLQCSGSSCPGSGGLGGGNCNLGIC